MMYLTTPQVAGLVMSITSIACLFIMVSGYYMIKLMTPQRVAVSVTMPTVQPVRSDISRLRKLADSLPYFPPQDERLRALSQTLQRALTWMDLFDESPEAARRGIESALKQATATFDSLT